MSFTIVYQPLWNFHVGQVAAVMEVASRMVSAECFALTWGPGLKVDIFEPLRF